MAIRPFETLLIANRGEIAVRVARTAKHLGYRTVAVYSDADEDAAHALASDEAIRIGPPPATQSYLNVEAILEAARRSGADAIHPGYGFLSENAAFAQACEDAGLVFVGPPPGAIAAMGDKAEAKARMRAHDVPVVPGFDDGDATDEALIEAAGRIGFPLLVKAAAGGGGRGMRRVDRPDDLPAALTSARSEAASAFGSGRLILEKLIERARHVEVQVLADAHGQIVHLFERDCSVQRRHQKVVEEAPSPAVDEELRARMGEAAIRAAASVGYVGAGTVEFLLAEDRSFHFLEMNTRLQVEHPVTEAITGLDLVALQLQVASGEPLAFDRDELRIDGHAIEVRLYAEDPSRGHLPQTGRVHRFVRPPGVRVDDGLLDGRAITAHYDPMIAKLIAHGPSRDVARRRLARALAETEVLGLRTNRRFLGRILAHPRFARGEATTRFLEEEDLTADPPLDAHTRHVAAALFAAGHGYDGFRTGHPMPQPVALEVDGARIDALVDRRSGAVEIDGVTAQVELREGGSRVRVDGHDRSVHVHRDRQALLVAHRGDVVTVRPFDPVPRHAETKESGVVRAPSAGRIRSVRVEPGSHVAAGEALGVIEAMKLETTLGSPIAGRVTEVRVRAEETVSADRVLFVVEPETSDEGMEAS